MRRLSLIAIFLILLYTGLQALTITRDHFGYRDGAQRNFRQGSWDISSTDTSEGTGKLWSFALPSTGWVNSSYQHVASVPGFPGANISSYYSQFVNGYSASGYIYYQDNGDDILTCGYSGAPNTIWNPPIPTGLPHYLGKTWQGTHAYTYGNYSVQGKVISQGIATTHLGSFPALCIRYLYSTTNFSYYCYQWETAEYGIIAYSFTLNDGMLYVLHEAEANSVFTHDSAASPLFSAAIYPNPSHGTISLDFELKQPANLRISLFNLRGQKLYSRDYHALLPGRQRLEAVLKDSSGSRLPKGLYTVKLDTGDSITTHRLILH